MTTVYVNTICADIINCMKETLGAFVKRKRAEQGWNQTELAAKSGVDRAYLSQIESDKVGLPGALIRRQLATALGLRHIDILIASGEISADEVDFPADPRSDAVRRLAPVVDRYVWHDGDIERISNLIKTLGEMREGTFEVPEVEG